MTSIRKPLDEIINRASALREAVLCADTTDIRGEMAQLCGLVSRLAAIVEETEQKAKRAANTASCLANGMIPD